MAKKKIELEENKNIIENDIVEEVKKNKGKIKVFNSSKRKFILDKNTILDGESFAEISKINYEKIKNFKEIKLI